eukprot:364335-Chlamydomonas_euryale.AAC.3
METSWDHISLPRLPCPSALALPPLPMCPCNASPPPIPALALPPPAHVSLQRLLCPSALALLLLQGYSTRASSMHMNPRGETVSGMTVFS